MEVSKSFIAENQDMAYCIINGFVMSEGNYTASVKAVNKMYLRSAPIQIEVIVVSQEPTIKGIHKVWYVDRIFLGKIPYSFFKN